MAIVEAAVQSTLAGVAAVVAGYGIAGVETHD